VQVLPKHGEETGQWMKAAISAWSSFVRGTERKTVKILKKTLPHEMAI
jgi:hypothetical protein